MGPLFFANCAGRRIEKAKYYLLCTDLSVTDVSGRTGFSTVALFSRVFHQETGKSPRDFRAGKTGL